MKTKLLLLVLSVVTLPLFSQTWTAGTGTLYLNPTTTRLGIGTTTPAANRMIDIVLPSLTYDSKVAVMGNLNVNGSSFKADLQGRIITGGSWSAIGQGSGVSGALTNLSYLSTSSAETFAHGGTFGVTFNGFTGSFATKSYVSGVSGYVNGTISSYPSNLVIAAVLGRDNIKGTGTLAGYFDGKVQVTGKIECNEIEVKNIGADFVFSKNYSLMPLSDVESFIQKNGHLPGVASAEVTEKGVNLGEFNEKLLQKIEELTLYVIEQNKKIEKLQQENKTLLNSINNK